MTSPRRTTIEHVLTADFEPIGPHIQAADTVSGGPSVSTHDKLHDMSSHTDRHKGADLASATTITFGTNGDYFHVTGTVKVTSMASRPPGDRVLIRIISAGLVIEHKTGTLNMRGKVDLLSESDTISEFISEGLNSAGNAEWTEIRRFDSQAGLDQAFEVALVAIVAPPDLVDSTSTGTGTSGVISTSLAAIPVPGAPTVSVAVT